MMNRRDFIRTGGLAGLAGIIAGPAFAQKLLQDENSLVYVISGGIWNYANAENRNMLQFSSGNQIWRLPIWANKAKNAKFGLVFGQSNDLLSQKLKNLTDRHLNRGLVRIHTAPGKNNLYSINRLPLPAMNIDHDLKTLNNDVSAPGLHLFVLHSTDLAHHSTEAYYNAETALMQAISEKIKRHAGEKRIHLICLHGRDRERNHLGGIDHATAETAEQGWWLEF